MRLTKAKKEEYIKQVRASRAANVVPIKDYDTHYAWLCLAQDHFSKLHLDLEHVSGFWMTERLDADTLDGGNIITTKEYFEHYNTGNLQMILSGIIEAQSSMKRLNTLVLAELARRGEDEGDIVRLTRALYGGNAHESNPMPARIQPEANDNISQFEQRKRTHRG